MSFPHAQRFLFVYGTLMGQSPHPMSQLLRKEAEFVKPGRFNGQLFQIDWYPGAIDSDIPNEYVYGEVWSFPESSELLSKLDEYEGYYPDDPEASEYLRVMREVTSPEGDRYICDVYLYKASLDKAVAIPDGRFKT
jgi:gamma-glutamylcyclotransferase (GGCT)/AIG2-like uncharacterized protein YtfP